MKNKISTILAICLCVLSFNSVSNAQEYPQVEQKICSDIAVWVVKNKNIPVYYMDGSCGHLTKNVLQNVSDDAVAGEFDWTKMQNPNFREHVLYQECRRLKNEEKYRMGITSTRAQEYGFIQKD